MRIWIDIEDLFEYFANSRRPSGIQRLVHELAGALRTQLGEENIMFLRRNHAGVDFNVVPWTDVDALFRRLDAAGAASVRSSLVRPAEHPLRTQLRRVAYRIPLGLRQPLLRIQRAFGSLAWSSGEVVRSVFGLFRAVWAGVRLRLQPARRTRTLSIAEMGFAPGDYIAALGSPWLTPNYAELLARARANHGAKVAILIYDLIPILHPEWCGQGLVQTFDIWMRTSLPQADRVMAISRSTARDVERYAAQSGIALPGPVVALPVGTGFGADLPAVTATTTARLPAAGSYVLFVSTMEARKNHQLLFRVWRRLLREMPADAVPELVFAGRKGWMVDDLIHQLRNASFLNGKIVLVDNPSDGELKSLYNGCLFTVFPSLYEGWGLPVTESLSLGKPCIVSNAASLPEAGGALARYFDPENATEATAVIRAVLEDRAGLAAWEAQVVREFRPVSWEVSARALVDILEAEA